MGTCTPLRRPYVFNIVVYPAKRQVGDQQQTYTGQYAFYICAKKISKAAIVSVARFYGRRKAALAAGTTAVLVKKNERKKKDDADSARGAAHKKGFIR